ncbi:DUF2442 domain-containing protein [bacterium]|nr:DUF2442 domain-containing protein [bacterium]
MNELPRIKSLTVLPDGAVLLVFFSGESRRIDFTRYAKLGPVFAGLRDPAYASRCRKVDYGYALRWPNGEDMAAGALLKMGKAVPAKNTGTVSRL